MNYTNYRCENCQQNCYVDESTKEVAETCPFCRGVLYLIGKVEIKASDISERSEICNPDSPQNN